MFGYGKITQEFLDSFEDISKGKKGIVMGTEPVPRQIELYMELLTRDEKCPRIGGEAALNTRSVPGYPNSLMGCCSEDLEHISGFVGLGRTIGRGGLDTLMQVVLSDRKCELFQRLVEFLVYTPCLALKLNPNPAFGARRSNARKPTPPQNDVTYVHVLCFGPLLVLAELCAHPRVGDVVARLREHGLPLLLSRLEEISSRRQKPGMQEPAQLAWRALCAIRAAEDGSVSSAQPDSKAIVVSSSDSVSPVSSAQRASPGPATPKTKKGVRAPAVHEAVGGVLALAGPTTAESKASEGCKTCGDLEKKLAKCSQCLRVGYCSRDCQRADWKAHKPFCHRLEEP